MHPTKLEWTYVDLAGKWLKHAWNVARSIINAWSRRDNLAFSNSETFALNACAPGRHVLQLGVGQPNMAAELRRKLCHVTAIDFFAKGREKRSTAPCSTPQLPENVSWFDQIVLMDLIEQLDDAETFLSELRGKMARRGSEIIITAVNAASLASRALRALSQSNYGSAGILAVKRRRFFTLQSLRALLEQTGYEIVEVGGIPAPFSMAIGNNRWTRALLRLNQLLVKISTRLFAYQICVRARPISGSPSFLTKTVAISPRLPMQVLGRVA